MGLVSGIIKLLDKKEKKEAVGILFLTIIMALFEMIGVASILPFMAVLSSPEIIETNRYLAMGQDIFNFQTSHDYLVFLGLAAFACLIAGNAIKALTRWKTINYSIMTGHTISSRLFYQYLHQPYDFFLKNNSSDLSKNILVEVHMLVSNVIAPMVDVVSRLIVIAAIVFILMVTDPWLAISTTVVIGGGFMAIYVMMRKWLHGIGQERLKAQGDRYRIVNEALLGIKNIKLTSHENTYVNDYKIPSESFSKRTAMNSISGELPKYIIELLAFGGILLIIIYLLMQERDLSYAIPLISLYAFAGYRLMPSMQAVFLAYTKIRFYQAVIEKITEEMDQTALSVSQNRANDIDGDLSPLPFQKTIRFENVSFKYEAAKKAVLKDLNLEITKNSTVGIVGKTGSGKTTIVDLLLGLLSPVSGAIYVDDIKLDADNLVKWQKNCAYVTQHIYLCDDTVASNIAFGVPKDQIDYSKVEDVAKMAALDEFVMNDLSDGYDTVIGENGIRLSGGQRQRIGLARALYLDRPVLVLDEATSALDVETEKSIMESVYSLSPDKTIIMISHRPETLNRINQTIKL